MSLLAKVTILLELIPLGNDLQLRAGEIEQVKTTSHPSVTSPCLPQAASHQLNVLPETLREAAKMCWECALVLKAPSVTLQTLCLNNHWGLMLALHSG